MRVNLWLAALPRATAWHVRMHCVMPVATNPPFAHADTCLPSTFQCCCDVSSAIETQPRAAQFGVIQLAAFHKDWYTETQKAWRFFGLKPDPFVGLEQQVMQEEQQLANVNPRNVDSHYSKLDDIPADRAAAYDLLDDFYR